jgi:hypothetical protein
MAKEKAGGSSLIGSPWLRPVSSIAPMPGPAAPAAPAAPSMPSPSMPGPAPGPGGNIDFLSNIIYNLNTNPYLIGILMLLLNLGGRFLSLELTKKQEEFLQQRWIRPLIFFTVIFVATRNLAVAFWVTILFFIIIWILANEKSPFCLIPSWKEESATSASNNLPAAQYEQNMSFIEKLSSTMTK